MCNNETHVNIYIISAVKYNFLSTVSVQKLQKPQVHCSATRIFNFFCNFILQLCFTHCHTSTTVWYIPTCIDTVITKVAMGTKSANIDLLDSDST